MIFRIWLSTLVYDYIWLITKEEENKNNDDNDDEEKEEYDKKILQTNFLNFFLKKR